MSALTNLTLAAARDGLKRKDFSAKEIAQAHIDAIDAGNEALNAYILLTPDLALKMAQALGAGDRLHADDFPPLVN